MIAIKQRFLKILKATPNYIDDVLVLGGLTIIIIATFLISKIIGMYVLGVTMFGLGVFFSRHPPRG